MKILNCILFIFFIIGFSSMGYAMDHQSNQKNTFPAFGASLGAEATHPYFGQHLEVIKPNPEKNGKISTLNAMGFMDPNLDIIAEDFLSFSKGAKLPVLDIGAAYGVASLVAIKQGNTVIANDIAAEHLIYIAQQKSLSIDEKKRLYLNNLAVPNEIDFPENALHAILMREVLHFLTPRDIETFFLKASHWLRPGGRLYLTVMSPYHYALKGFVETYENRLQTGSEWPGIITDITANYLPNLKGKIPDYLHVMDIRVLLPVILKQGFLIKKMELYGKHADPRDTGLGHVGLVLIKAS